MLSVTEKFDKEYPFKTVPELLRWAKKKKLIEKDVKRKPIQLDDNEWAIPRISKSKTQKLNKKTGRLKKQPTTTYLKTDISPEKRTLKNLPRDAKKNAKIRFQDWLNLKKSPNLYPKLNNVSWGWGSDGRCYGWSHRVIHGFGIGDKIKKDTIGNWKNEPWEISSDKDAERMAKEFARGVS